MDDFKAQMQWWYHGHPWCSCCRPGRDTKPLSRRLARRRLKRTLTRFLEDAEDNGDES